MKQIRSLERHLNGLEIMPATNRLRSAVILPLLSKALTVSRAVCVLVDAGYPGEAFGLSRTILEILLIVGYIANKETEQRARRYRDYDAKARAEFDALTKKYMPNSVASTRRLDDAVMKLASQYSKHSWLGRGQTAAMAREENTVEFDKTGKGITIEFEYEALYFWTSQYVHATVAGIHAHAVGTRQVFKVRVHPEIDRDRGRVSLLIIVTSLCQLFIFACRSMNETQPKAVRELFKMIRRTNKRRRRS